MNPRKNAVKVFFLSCLCLSLIARPACADSPLEILQEHDAYVGQEIALTLKGLSSQPGTLYEWTFSGGAKAIGLRDGGSRCVFTPVDTSPMQASVVARSPQGQVLDKADVSITAKEFTVSVFIPKQDPFLLWSPSAKEDVPTSELVAGEPIRFSATLSPEFKGKTRFLWRADASTSIVQEDEGPDMTLSRSEIGESEISVSVVNEDGIFLGRGGVSADISVSRAEVETSARRKKAWGDWLTAQKLWNERQYEKALEGARAATKLDPETLEITNGMKIMTADFNRIQRASQIRAKAEAMRKESNLAEALKTYRRALVVWPTDETQADIEAVQKAVNDLRLKRQETEWLRDTAAAYDQEGMLAEALELYKKTQAPEPSPAVAERMERISQKLSAITSADRLAGEGNTLEKSGKITEALERYRSSLKLQPNAELQAHVEDLENVLKESKAKAAALIREGIDLYKRKNGAEALARFKESQMLWPLPETQKRIAALEGELKGTLSRAPRTPNEFGIGTKTDAARLFRDGDALYQSGRYREALEKYRKSYAISHDPKLAEWIQRIEVSLKEYESIRKANETIKEANNLYNQGRHNEALAKYKESLNIHANSDVAAFIKQLEATLAGSGQKK